MDKQRVLRNLVAAVLAVFGASGTALAVEEIEPNGSISSAQQLQIGSDGTATVNAVIGSNFSGAVLDVDFYSFTGEQGDKVTIDIDNGAGGLRTLDTYVALYLNSQKLVENDDMEEALDAGSIDTMDSRISDFPLPAAGTYNVGVSSFKVFLEQDGTYSTLQAGENGDYTLIITLVKATPVPVPPPAPAETVPQISIDIKPGKGGRIRVALLSSGAVKANQVDPRSLTFGKTGNEPSLRKCGKSEHRRVMCQFKTELTGLTAADGYGVLKGRTRGGVAFEGRGTVKLAQRRSAQRSGDDDDDDD